MLRDEQQRKAPPKNGGNGRLDPAAFFEMDDFQGLLYFSIREGISSFQIICAWLSEILTW